jgi:predicted Zn-ribbon and HTH transcriptional regulator
MKCNSCNAVIPSAGKFCPECGATSTHTMACTHCGEQNPPNSSFCAGCGQTLKSQTQPQQISEGSEDITTDFVFLLSEEKMRAVSNNNVRIPYGCFAVTVVNGVVNSTQDQISANSSEPSAISDFFKSVSEFARGLIGQKNNDVKTYIVSNCEGLPLISYVHSLNLPAVSNTNLRFDFWLDLSSEKNESTGGALGLFLQKVMNNKTRLSTAEFRQTAIASVQSILQSQQELKIDSQESLDAIMSLLKKTTGISGRCLLNKGKLIERRYVEVSKIQQPVHCSQCNEGYISKIKFCEACGANMDSADWGGSTQMLQSASGEVISLKISLLSEKENDSFSDEQIASIVISALNSDIRKFETNQVTEVSMLEVFGKKLNKDLANSFNGILRDISVIDIRSAGQEWFFKTEALIAEELRKIDTQQRELSIDERALDFNEAAFALAMRSASQRDDHRRKELQLRAQTVEIEIDELTLESRTELRKAGISLDAEGDLYEIETRSGLRKESIDHVAEGDRLEREKEKSKREREFQRDVTKDNRADELDQAHHEIKLEKTVAQHDIELADMTGEAQSRSKRRDIADTSFETEEQIRLKAAERTQLGNIEEDLQDRQNQRQVDKMKAMAEMEANMAKQDHEFQLAKVNSMQAMDAAQILAAQAAELVKAGGNAAAADIVKSIAQSQADAAGTAIKDDLYKQMLQTKDDAAKLALDSQKTALDALIKNNESIAKLAGGASSNAIEGYKEAAKVAQSTNEKSMDSMSKVATATAAKKPSKEEAESAMMTDCKNQECDFVFEGKVKKFCPKCGTNQL